MSVSHDIFLEASSRVKDLSLADMARKIGTPTGGLWYCAKGERKWTVEKWIGSLIYLGVAKIDGDSIIISTVHAKDFNRPRGPGDL